MTLWLRSGSSTRGNTWRSDEGQRTIGRLGCSAANNAEEYPDPALPTYEHCSEWVEGAYVKRHAPVPGADID